VNAFILIGFILFFAWRGFRAGGLKIFLRVISLLAGYLTAYTFSVPVSSYLSENEILSPPWNYLVAVLGLFLGVSFLVTIVFVLAGFVFSRVSESRPKPAKILGLWLGVALGSFMGLLVVWVAGVFQDTSTLRRGAEAGQPGLLQQQEVKAGSIRDLSEKMVGGMVGFAIKHKVEEDSALPELVSSVVAKPVVMGEQLSALMRSEEMKRFFNDPLIKDMLGRKNVNGLVNSYQFHDLLGQPGMENFLLVVAGETPADQLERQELAAEQLIMLWTKTMSLQQDPRFVAIMQDPEFQESLQNPGPLGLLTNPRLQELSEIIFSLDEKWVAQHGGQGRELIDPDAVQQFKSVAKTQWSSLKDVEEEQGGKVIYRWTDKAGRKHYSEERPEGDYDVQITRQ